MTDAALSDLDPRLLTLAGAFVSQVNTTIAPSTCKIIVTWRDPAAQNAAHAKGLSKACAGQSPHNCVDSDGTPCSRAFDFAIIDPVDGYVTDGTDHRYTTAGTVAVGLGLKWGGDFVSFKDYDHCELADWQS